jgi:hypothetical protein
MVSAPTNPRTASRIWAVIVVAAALIVACSGCAVRWVGQVDMYAATSKYGSQLEEPDRDQGAQSFQPTTTGR